MYGHICVALRSMSYDLCSVLYICSICTAVRHCRGKWFFQGLFVCFLPARTLLTRAARSPRSGGSVRQIQNLHHSTRELELWCVVVMSAFCLFGVVEGNTSSRSRRLGESNIHTRGGSGINLARLLKKMLNKRLLPGTAPSEGRGEGPRWSGAAVLDPGGGCWGRGIPPARSARPEPPSSSPPLPLPSALKN